MNKQEPTQFNLRQEVKNTENLLRTYPFFQNVVNCAIFHNVKKLNMESCKDHRDYFWQNPMITFSDDTTSEFDLDMKIFVEEMGLSHHLVTEELEEALANLSSFGRYVNALNKDSKIVIDENGVSVNLGLSELELDTMEDTQTVIEHLHKINSELILIQPKNSKKFMRQ